MTLSCDSFLKQLTVNRRITQNNHNLIEIELRLSITSKIGKLSRGEKLEECRIVNRK